MLSFLGTLGSRSESRQIIWIWICPWRNISILLDLDFGSFGSTTLMQSKTMHAMQHTVTPVTNEQ